jgi:hypothetical protein
MREFFDDSCGNDEESTRGQHIMGIWRVRMRVKSCGIFLCEWRGSGGSEADDESTKILHIGVRARVRRILGVLEKICSLKIYKNLIFRT